VSRALGLARVAGVSGRGIGPDVAPSLNRKLGAVDGGWTIACDLGAARGRYLLAVGPQVLQESVELIGASVAPDQSGHSDLRRGAPLVSAGRRSGSRAAADQGKEKPVPP
jgi:hypothetical protein